MKNIDIIIVYRNNNSIIIMEKEDDILMDPYENSKINTRRYKK